MKYPCETRNFDDEIIWDDEIFSIVKQDQICGYQMLKNIHDPYYELYDINEIYETPTITINQHISSFLYSKTSSLKFDTINLIKKTQIIKTIFIILEN